MRFRGPGGVSDGDAIETWVDPGITKYRSAEIDVNSELQEEF